MAQPVKLSTSAQITISRYTVPEFKPFIGLCADGLEPGAYFGFCVSLSLWPSPAHTLSLFLSKINKH